MAVNDHALHSLTISSDTEERALSKFFIAALNTLSNKIVELQLAAAAVMTQLDLLNMRLISIHNHIMRNGSAPAVAQGELPAHLWMELEGHRKTVRGVNTYRALLGISPYHARALALVATTIQVLNAFAEEIEALRVSVTVSTTKDNLPDDVLIRHAFVSLKRLQEQVKRTEMRRRDAEESVRRGQV